jgi:methionine-rich copper-binding protein CopC
MEQSLCRRRLLRALPLLPAAILAWPGIARARPMQVANSTPLANAVIHGPHAEYVIRFDGPINHRTSRLAITQGGHLVQELTPRLDSSVDVLFASAAVPPPGDYMLHWQAESGDGEMSTGDIPFTVAP